MHTWLSRLRIALLVPLVAGLFVSGSDPYPFQRGLRTVLVTTGEHSLQAEVAVTPDQWWRGLSFRTTLAQDKAMLFVFDKPQSLRFSARNTLIPLSVAFIDEAGTIVDIKSLEHNAERFVASSGAVRFAIETNAGWFSRRGIGPGDRLLAPGYIPTPMNND